MPVSDLVTLLQTMEPVRNPGVYVFAVLPVGSAIDPEVVVAYIREPEGCSVVVAEATAARMQLAVLFRAAWITLTVHSDLSAVGLTAAISAALADAGIGCNVVAGAVHDHLFVPDGRAADAMDVLRELQRSAQSHGMKRDVR